MTKKQREQVVELLRCTHGSPFTVFECARELDIESEVRLLADSFMWRAMGEMDDVNVQYEGDERYDIACLEAAQMVEEGRWP